ncbi:Hypothetical_protein [Hexamita inflata]|uniref:Hypothetical_protein n=1 Tax=Hexamita inflata TaxID=28002 RepID=A0ABP1H6T7_9EUKA
MKCKTCNIDTEIKYNGYPLCVEHYNICVRNKIHKNFKPVSPCQKFILLGFELIPLQVAVEFLENHIKQYVIDPAQSIQIAIPESLTSFKSQYPIITLKAQNYFQQQVELQAYGDVSTIIDCSSGELIAKRVLKAVCLGSITLGQQVSKPLIVTKMDVNFNSKDNLKVQNLKFVNPDKRNIVRVFQSTGKEELYRLKNIQYEAGKAVDDEIVENYNNINRIYESEVIEGDVCDICEAVVMKNKKCQCQYLD